MARKKYRVLAEITLPQDPHLRRIFLKRKVLRFFILKKTFAEGLFIIVDIIQLGQATDVLVGEVQSSKDDIDTLFAEIDSSLEVSRLTLGEADRSRRSGTDWTAARQQVCLLIDFFY